jgi:hypothetical protein
VNDAGVPEDWPRFFFVHIMKTGGTTLRRHVEHNFPAPGAVYPDRRVDLEPRDGYMFIQRLLTLPPERRDLVRTYIGHFPFVVAQLIDPRLTTLTMLREPVDRTISYLKHCKRFHPQHQDLGLEEIYDDGFVFPTLVHDHQVKIFAMTADDRLESYMDVVEIDDERRRIAEANLERVDLVGLHERYDDFLGEIVRRFGWEIKQRATWLASEDDPNVSTSFRRRIADDNAQDLAFYEFARDLVERS